jgi:hypothetical protein
LQALSAFKNRRIVLMARLENDLKVFICRMVLPQNPPEYFIHSSTPQNQEDALIRYVFAIPNVSDTTIFEFNQAVWMTFRKFFA